MPVMLLTMKEVKAMVKQIDKIGLDVEFTVKNKEGRILYVDDSIA